MDELARIHDQVLDAYTAGNPVRGPDPEASTDDEREREDDSVPPWVDDYVRDA